jgi:hypothetical protein
VALTRGVVREEGTFVRGYGWEYIDAVSAVTQEEIGNALRASEEEVEGVAVRQIAVEKTENARYVVAVRGPPDNTLLILKIAGGALYRAAKHEFDRDIDEQELADEAERSLDQNGDETIERTTEDGTYAELLRIAGHDTADTYAGTSLDNKERFGESVVEAYENGWLTEVEIGSLIEATKSVEDVDGLESGPIRDIINSNDEGEITGYIREIHVAEDIGSDNIRKMSLELPDSSGYDGELDIVLQSGEVVEVKSSFGYDKNEINRTFRRKLRTMREANSVKLDQNTLTIRAGRIGNENLVSTLTNTWEAKVANDPTWNNANITIRVDQ